MKTTILTSIGVLLLLQLTAQNLVNNPGAESLPRGTGWTIVSQGALTCTSAPTTNVLNWTMKPNGTANYPWDHTTGANGGTVFFPGCDTYFTGPFELQQTIDVSIDAVNIDAGSQVYTFSGYMQTPVNNQSDQGRYIVDYLNASNTVLGTSYTSAWQSYYLGSGINWTFYNNTRIAPAGTRKIRIRMQAEIHFNQPAINVYFDDISLTRPNILPLNLLSFTAKQEKENVQLTWTVTNELPMKQFDLQYSGDANHFTNIANFRGGKTNYSFIDNDISHAGQQHFYRLKMSESNGTISYSNIVAVQTHVDDFITLSPNPATNILKVTSSISNGTIAIIHSNGEAVLKQHISTPSVTIDVSALAAGLYVVRFSDQKTTINKKLVIQKK